MVAVECAVVVTVLHDAPCALSHRLLALRAIAKRRVYMIDMAAKANAHRLAPLSIVAIDLPSSR